MKDLHTLIAFLALILAIVVLSTIGAVTGKPADLAIMTGLIGVLGTFLPRQPGRPRPSAGAEPADTANRGGRQ